MHQTGKPLVEEVHFEDQNGDKVKVGVFYPWLPARCSVCSKWGHKTNKCQSKDVRILTKSKELSPVVEVVENEGHGGSEEAVKVVETLLSELEATHPFESKDDAEKTKKDVLMTSPIVGVNEVCDKEVSEMQVETVDLNGKGEASVTGWTNASKAARSTSLLAKFDSAKCSESSTSEAGDVNSESGSYVISPSRFQPLVQRDEEETEESIDNEDTLEEGEIKNMGLSSKRKGVAHAKSSKKVARYKNGKTKNSKSLSVKGQSKKFSVRKI